MVSCSFSERTVYVCVYVWVCCYTVRYAYDARAVLLVTLVYNYHEIDPMINLNSTVFNNPLLKFEYNNSRGFLTN